MLKFYIIISIFILFFLIILIIFFNNKGIKKTKSKSLAPLGYTLFYSDKKEHFKAKNIICSKVLFSRKYNLSGKPDYVYKKNNLLFPIELKSGAIKDLKKPHEGDFMQLIAYFLILEDVYNAKIRKGKLIYSDYSFIIKNKKKFKKRLFKVLKSMRFMLKTGIGEPNCNFSHCKYCVCKLTVCKFYKQMYNKR